MYVDFFCIFCNATLYEFSLDKFVVDLESFQANDSDVQSQQKKNWDDLTNEFGSSRWHDVRMQKKKKLFKKYFSLYQMIYNTNQWN